MGTKGSDEHIRRGVKPTQIHVQARAADVATKDEDMQTTEPPRNQQPPTGDVSREATPAENTTGHPAGGTPSTHHSSWCLLRSACSP